MTRLLIISLLFISTIPALAQNANWIPIDTSEGRVKFASSIGGIEGYSTLSSGANVNIINETFIESNNLDIRKTGRKIRIGGLVSEQDLGIYAPIDLRVFGSELRIKSLIASRYDDPKMQVMLGEGFLRHLVVQIDYPNQRMRFLNRKTNNLKKLSNIKSKRARAHEKLNLIGGRRLGADMPMVKVRLNNETNAWLLLSISSDRGILLDRKVVERTSWLEDYASESKPQKRPDDINAVDSFVLPTIKFGPFNIDNVPAETPAIGTDFHFFQSEKSTGTHIPKANRVAMGTIGYEVLKHFVVTLDYNSGLVHIGTKASD